MEGWKLNETRTAIVVWSEEDQGYIATDPRRPGCSAWGENQGDALMELMNARMAWDEAQLAAGNPPPGSQ